MQEQISFQLFINGNESGLTAFYRQYRQRLYWHGMGLLKDTFPVETIVQEAFFKLWTCRNRMKSPGHVYNFLFMVVTRDCISMYYKAPYRFHHNTRYLEEYENYQDRLCDHEPEEEIQENRIAQLEKTLLLLSPHKQKLIRLCLEHDFHYRKIGLLLNLSFQSVATEVREIIKELKDIVNRGHDLEKAEKPVIKINNGINQEQEKILQMRYNNGYSFSQIARIMNLPQLYVQKQFIVAYKRSKKTT